MSETRPTTRVEWEDRYSKIVDYSVSPDSADEHEKARLWSQGANIDDNGNVVRETKQVADVPPPTFVGNGKPEVNHLLKPEPVSAENDLVPEFPGEDLFHGGFRNFYDAYWKTNEVCEPFLMAAALTQAGAMMGRRCCISISKNKSERYVIYPNFYNIVIGPTSIARKSTLIKSVKYDIFSVDNDVKMLASIASSEGLIDVMSKDSEGEPIRIDPQEFQAPEGTRTLLMVDEIRSLFVASRRAATENIIPKLTEIYNCDEIVEVPTKTSPIKAFYPTLNIIGASTEDWLKESVTQSDVAGGFINRCGFFLYEYVESKPDPEDPRKTPLSVWKNILGQMRMHGDSMRNFTLSPDTWDVYKDIYNEHRENLWDNKDDPEIAATARKIGHAFKIALAFAAATNGPDNNIVDDETFLAALGVAEYISDVSVYLFGNAGVTEKSKNEDVFLQALGKLGNVCSRRDIQRKIGGKKMSREEFNKAMESLERAGVIVITEGKSTTITRVE